MAVISNCDDVNIAHISVMTTFLLKEVHNIRDKELQEEDEDEPNFDSKGEAIV